MKNHSQKILTKNDLNKLVSNLRRSGKKIITYNGSFDLLHSGHIQSIREAKSLGDVLIILLNSDKSIKSYKGPNRPIIPEKERAELLAALSDVDYVVIFDDITPVSFLSEIKPNIHCNGSDWGKECVEANVVKQNGGKIHILKWQKGYSSTRVIERIIEVYKKPSLKAVFIDRDGTLNQNKEGYIHTKEDFEFMPSAIKALKRLSKTNYFLFIVTNQSGIGRGLYTLADFKKLTLWVEKELQKKGIKIKKTYYCPHIPENNCSCRKPGIGMFLDAVTDYGISLNDSWIIGDSEADVGSGRNANIKTIKIGEKISRTNALAPNFYAKNLNEAVDIILGEK